MCCGVAKDRHKWDTVTDDNLVVGGFIKLYRSTYSAGPTAAAARAGWICRICAGTAPAPSHGRIGTGLTPPTSAPGLGSPRPHLRRDCAHPAHICAGTAPAPSHGRIGTARARNGATRTAEWWRVRPSRERLRATRRPRRRIALTAHRTAEAATGVSGGGGGRSFDLISCTPLQSVATAHADAVYSIALIASLERTP